jgi:hypothetical protein
MKIQQSKGKNIVNSEYSNTGMVACITFNSNIKDKRKNTWNNYNNYN